MPIGEKQILRFGPYQLDTQCGQLRKNGYGLKLQGQPVQILEILLEKPGELVTREELRQRLWSSDTFVDFDHSLNAAIQRLRQALGDEAESPQYVETIPKRGYRFVGEVIHDGMGNGSSQTASLIARIPEKTASTPPDVATSASRKSSRRRWMILVSSVVGATALAVAIHWATRPPPMPHIVGSRPLTNTGFRKQRFWSRMLTDGQRIYFQEQRPSGMVTMQVSVTGGDVSQVSAGEFDYSILRDINNNGTELLYSILSPKTGIHDAFIQPLPTGPRRLILKNAGWWPMWTPDGAGILFSRNNDKDLYRANSDGTNAYKLATFPDITDPAISPNGKRIRFAVYGDGMIWEAGADGTNPHPILVGAGGTWSPDGKYFFFMSFDGDRYNIWSVAEHRHWWALRKSVPAQLTFGPFSSRVPAVSKDGRQLYAVLTTTRGELSAYDSESHRFVPYLSGIPACFADFSRDGEWIVYVSLPERNLWRSKIDGTERRQLTTQPFIVLNPRWSPDGRFIAFTDLSGGDRRKTGNALPRIYLISAEGGAPLLLPVDVGGDSTWSPDSAAIAYAANEGIRILDLKTQKSTMVSGSEKLYSPRWSPDGRYLVALNPFPSTKLMLFSFATQHWEELTSGTNICWPSWSRDSRQVVFGDSGQPGAALFRVAVSNRQKEQIVHESTFRSISTVFAGWYGITPDGRVISTRDTSIDEIYAFDLEYK